MISLIIERRSGTVKHMQNAVTILNFRKLMCKARLKRNLCFTFIATVSKSYPAYFGITLMKDIIIFCSIFLFPVVNSNPTNG